MANNIWASPGLGSSESEFGQLDLIKSMVIGSSCRRLKALKNDQHYHQKSGSDVDRHSLTLTANCEPTI